MKVVNQLIGFPIPVGWLALYCQRTRRLWPSLGALLAACPAVQKRKEQRWSINRKSSAFQWQTVNSIYRAALYLAMLVFKTPSVTLGSMGSMAVWQGQRSWLETHGLFLQTTDQRLKSCFNFTPTHCCQRVTCLNSPLCNNKLPTHFRAEAKLEPPLSPDMFYLEDPPENPLPTNVRKAWNHLMQTAYQMSYPFPCVDHEPFPLDKTLDRPKEHGPSKKCSTSPETLPEASVLSHLSY